MRTRFAGDKLFRQQNRPQLRACPHGRHALALHAASSLVRAPPSESQVATRGPRWADCRDTQCAGRVCVARNRLPRCARASHAPILADSDPREGSRVRTAPPRPSGRPSAPPAALSADERVVAYASRCIQLASAERVAAHCAIRERACRLSFRVVRPSPRVSGSLRLRLVSFISLNDADIYTWLCYVYTTTQETPA